MVHSTTVYPHWLKNGNRFWYQYKTTEGSKYYLVDADKRTRKELFDNDKMASWLTEITKDPYDGKHLPKFDFKFVKMKKLFNLDLNQMKWSSQKGLHRKEKNHIYLNIKLELIV